jgi:formyltetrahydrofolate-dependent phosphoribosylglycinamide formyltransferase
MKKLRAAVLISGRGSNMMALVAAAQAADFPAEIVRVIANRADSAGLAFAAGHGIATEVIDHQSYSSRTAFDEALDHSLHAARIDLVALAGFMRVLSPEFTAKWAGRLLNIHPSLLPLYKGLHTHERALADAAAEHGCTVHFVNEELDGGHIIAQARVPVLPGDTPGSLAARVLQEEHRIYPMALAQVARSLFAASSA